jgi:hypothetical protein
MTNELYYGDNFDVLRRKIASAERRWPSCAAATATATAC